MRKSVAGLLAPVVLLVTCGGEDIVDGGVASKTTETSQATEVGEPSQPTRTSPVPLVLASPEGVVVTYPDGETTQVSTEPAVAAYGVTREVVVFQDAQPLDARFPPGPEGPVRVWSDGETRDLPKDPDAGGVDLLDARVVAGVPVALVAERFGGIGPDDTFEELVRVDLRDDSRTRIVRRPAWESTHTAGRLLSDGDAVGVFSAEAWVLLGRWAAGQEDALWTVEVGFDTRRDLTVRGGVIATIETGFDAERDFTPRVTVTTHDPATGAPGTPRTVDVDDPDDQIGTGLFCRDWLDATQLACGRSGGVPMAISIRNGSFKLLPGEPGAIPTVPHSS